MQRASLEPKGDGYVLRVCAASTAAENYARALSRADVDKCAAVTYPRLTRDILATNS